jgi:hypothetical protein
MTITDIIDRINLASCRAYGRPSECRICGIGCDPRTREYRAERVCQQCWDEELPTFKLVRRTPCKAKQ